MQNMRFGGCLNGCRPSGQQQRRTCDLHGLCYIIGWRCSAISACRCQEQEPLQRVSQLLSCNLSPLLKSVACCLKNLSWAVGLLSHLPTSGGIEHVSESSSQAGLTTECCTSGSMQHFKTVMMRILQKPHPCSSCMKEIDSLNRPLLPIHFSSFQPVVLSRQMVLLAGVHVWHL